MAVGYPAGGLVGGLLAALLLRLASWHAVFVAGGVAAIVMLAAVAAFLPESPGFLIASGGPRRLAQLNSLLVRFGHPALATPPPVPATSRGYAGVFSTSRLGSTLRLTIVNMLAAAVIYYVLSWLPQLVSNAGLAPAWGSLASATLSFFGIFGGLTLGALARRRGPQRITTLAIAGVALALVIFGVIPASLPALIAAAAVLGFLIFGASAGFYATLALAFDDASRAAGSGFVIGMGRISSAAAPLAAGWLFAAGLDRAAVSTAFAGCALVASIVLALHCNLEAQAA